MFSGYSLEKCAKLTGISKQTSFYWREKILTALGKFQKEQMLSGICLSDCVFIAFSQKGNKNLEREPRKRSKRVFIKKKPRISDTKIAFITFESERLFKKYYVAKKQTLFITFALRNLEK